MEPEREIYPNAPLEFVACEIRYPFAPGLVEDAALPKLHKSFYDWLPLVEPGFETTMVIGAGGAPTPPTTVKQLRFLSRDRQLGVLVTSGLISIETTRYTRFEDFKVSISRSLAGLASTVDVAGLARIGLRYIDEIRVPFVEGQDERSGWIKYIDPRLTGEMALEIGNRGPNSVQGTLQYDLGDGDHVVMRYGAMRGQSVGNVPLRRRTLESGAYFLIDIDSFWAPADLLPAFDVAAALAACDRLHLPVRALFEASITDQLRDDVLRSAAHGS
jgi:uncharacterized protein (TIGR04255 family)